MEIGIVGLGRMGGNMALRLRRAGHVCVGYARTESTVQKYLEEGAITAGARSLEDLVRQLPRPRTLWLMVPAASVDPTLTELVPLLDSDDVVIDGGNSHYHDDIRRAASLKQLGVHYLDIGTSGGVWGLERGYCLMIGGEAEVVDRLDPIFSALAPGLGEIPRTPGREHVGGTAERGYLHCGKSGAGHFIKMVHNGIEYAMMAALAEGFNLLHHANVGMETQEVGAEVSPLEHPEYYQYDFNLADIAEVWRRGSVIPSWLLDLTATALLDDPTLSGYKSQVSDSGEGRWTIQAAIDEGVPVDVLAAALFARFRSRGHADFGNQLQSAQRAYFGGHKAK